MAGWIGVSTEIFFAGKIVYERGFSSKPCLIISEWYLPTTAVGRDFSFNSWMAFGTISKSHPILQKTIGFIPPKMLKGSLLPHRWSRPNPPIPSSGAPSHLLVAAMIFTVVWLVKPSSWFSSSSIVLCTSRTPRGRSQVWNFQPLL